MPKRFATPTNRARHVSRRSGNAVFFHESASALPREGNWNFVGCDLSAQPRFRANARLSVFKVPRMPFLGVQERQGFRKSIMGRDAAAVY